MLIANNFIFLHTPKAAGSSMQRTLASTLPENIKSNLHRGRVRQYPDHTTVPTLLQQNPNFFENTFSFAFVRNPWGWAQSVYYWTQTRPLARWKQDLPKWTKMGFNEWVLTDQLQYFITAKTRWPLFQSEFVFNKTGKQAISFVGRFENLQNDFQYACDKLNIKVKLEIHSNKSKSHPPYQEEYSKEAKDKVAELLACDVTNFGYTFDGSISNE